MLGVLQPALSPPLLQICVETSSCLFFCLFVVAITTHLDSSTCLSSVLAFGIAVSPLSNPLHGIPLVASNLRLLIQLETTYWKARMTEPEIQPTETEVTDNRPLAVRRKRRLTSSLVNGDDGSISLDQTTSLGAASAPAKTPTKAKKKVRFSDPGPETTTLASSSTGLTPALKRTTFSQDSGMAPPKTPRLLSQNPRRRRSLPLNLSSVLPSPSPTPPATPVSGEVQFAPFRQVLDERLKRRMRRNNMSEEQNEIEADKGKSKAAWKQDMQDLKNELAAARQLQQETTDSVKGEDTSHERIRELELEIETLRHEMRERSMTVEPIAADDEPSAQKDTVPSIYNDNVDDDFVMVDANENEGSTTTIIPSAETGVLRDTTHLHVAAPSSDAASQTSIASSNAENEPFRSARLSLERLFPGEIALGLRSNDPKPLLDAMLERLLALKTQVLISNDSLATTRTQESNLRNQFNAVLQQLNRARSYAEKVANQRDVEKLRADTARKAETSVRRDLEKATGDIKGLETDVDEKERSIHRLQDALEGYRADVTRLEILITNMESDHKAALAKCQRDMDEAVADLDCQVAAETLGRRAAEGESVERGERIKQLRHLEQELRGSMNDKQGVIRDLEQELAKVKEMKEKEVGGLNAEIGKMASDLDEARTEMNKLNADKKTLLFRIEEEKAAGISAVEAMQSEIARCVEKSEDVKTEHIKDMQSRGVEVNEHKGLLTPVTGGRFKDVEGYVEIQRGKRKRPDSGIHVVEEEDEGQSDDFMLDSDL